MRATPLSVAEAALGALAVISCILTGIAGAQDLAPRSYVIAPVGSNAVTVATSFFRGDLNLNGAAPVDHAQGTFVVPTISYYRAFGFLGRSANFTVLLPYGVGTFRGETTAGPISVYRSGLTDSGVRISFNLKGGPAMSAEEFGNWKQTTLLGASLKIMMPTGQYDPSRLVNWGSNRWGFKPEFGYSHRKGNWLLDGYAGVWFFTENPQSFSLPTPLPQTRSPIASFEGHLMYDMKPRLWFSLDGNFWCGGTATVAGTTKPETRQTSSRIGGTASIPLNRRQSIKVSYSAGAFSRFGGDFHHVTFAWQYAWLDRSRGR